jgi:methylmalonyl-CoA/ethylmalonyl-CoA epimerase
MIKKVEHIAVAVKSVDASLRVFRDILGIPLEKVYESEAIKTKIAFFPVDGCTIELIEPLDPASPVAKFLERRGEGIHHLCLGVENMEAALAHYQEQGMPSLGKPRRTQDGRLIAFLNPKETHGVLIELTEMGTHKGGGK